MRTPEALRQRCEPLGRHSSCHHHTNCPERVPYRRFRIDVAANRQLTARHVDSYPTTIHDRRRENFDRHADGVVVVVVAGA
jgi:hypothetical protein